MAYGKSSGLAFDARELGYLYDSSINHHTLTNHGATPIRGKFGKGMLFDGINDYVDCGNDASLNITDAITIEAWVKVSDFGGASDGTIVGAEHSDWHRVYIQSDALHYNIYNGTTSWYKSKAYSFDADQWYHIVVVGDKANNMGYWYVNGAQIGSEPKTTWPTHNSCRLEYIGATSVTYDLFNGSIGGLKIYNRTLSAAEISANYKSYGFYGSEMQSPKSLV